MTEFGVGTYIRNVVRTLARLDRDSKYFLIGSLEKVAECGALPANFHAVALEGRDDTLKGNLAFRAIVRRLRVRRGSHSAPVSGFRAGLVVLIFLRCTTCWSTCMDRATLPLCGAACTSI